jgi:CelD/BcsL family acetyltransferase involved in cellulose biosynthesis
VMLYDGDQPVAGTNTILHGDVLTASVSFRDVTLCQQPTGTRAIDATFELAAERGFACFDIGGGHKYKERWAPVSGTRSSFVIAPPALHYSSRVLKSLRTCAERVTSLGAAQPR